MTAEREGLAEIAGVLAEHRYRDVLGDYEAAPFYKHFGCSCGWEQDIAGMSGWRSWVAAHDLHLADALADPLAARDRRVRAEAVREAADFCEATIGNALGSPRNDFSYGWSEASSQMLAELRDRADRIEAER